MPHHGLPQARCGKKCSRHHYFPLSFLGGKEGENRTRASLISTSFDHVWRRRRLFLPAIQMEEEEEEEEEKPRAVISRCQSEAPASRKDIPPSPPSLFQFPFRPVDPSLLPREKDAPPPKERRFAIQWPTLNGKLEVFPFPWGIFM